MSGKTFYGVAGLSGFSDIPGAGFVFLIKDFQPFFLDDLVQVHPSFIEVFVKICFVAGKLFTLKTKINLFFLVAGTDPAILEQFALFLAAALAVFSGQIIQHDFEIRVKLENGIVQHGFKSLGIDVKISQMFFEQEAVLADIAASMGKAFFAAEAAGGHGGFDLFSGHVLSPFE